MLTSLLSARTAAASAVGAGVLTGAMLFGGAPIAQAAPPPAPATTFAMSGPHGAPIPTRPGGGGFGHGGGWGHGGGFGHGGGWGHGGFGRGGGWGHGGFGRGGWGHGGWGHGGWGHGGWGHGGWGGRGGNWW
jgi:hypothetical protein